MIGPHRDAFISEPMPLTSCEATWLHFWHDDPGCGIRLGSRFSVPARSCIQHQSHSGCKGTARLWLLRPAANEPTQSLSHESPSIQCKIHRIFLVSLFRRDETGLTSSLSAQCPLLSANWLHKFGATLFLSIRKPS